MPRRKSYAGAEWAQRDAWLIGLFLALVAVAGFDKRAVWGVLAVLAYGAYLGVRHLVRERRKERVPPETPFWVDKIR